MKWLLHLALDVLNDGISRESHAPVIEGWLDVPGPFRQGRFRVAGRALEEVETVDGAARHHGSD
jgi:hypothetical protein